MMAKIKPYLDRIDAMTLRERVMIFLMLAAIIVALLWTFLIDPLTAKQKQLTQQLTGTQAQAQALEAQMQALAESAKRDPDAPNKQRLVELNSQREQAFQGLAKVKQGLVNADQMAGMLRDLLGKNSRLKLVEMKTLPVSALLDQPKPEPGASNALNPVVTDLGLYKHAVEISIDGAYADLLAYVAGLEQLPWRVYWSGMRLESRGYPVSRLTLTVYTLSLDKTWLAV